MKGVHYTAGFPEHSHKVLKTLIDLGLGSSDFVKIGGNEIKIIDFTREVLKSNKKPKDYKEVENVWVKVIGKRLGNNKTITMECITKTLSGYEFAGSNINTGMSISIMAQLLFNSLINSIGVTAPETCVPCIEFFKELSKRRMFVYENNKKIN